MSSLLTLFARRAAGGAAPFDPATLFASGEQGYILDPSDFSSMFQDAAGTIPVTATGQPVGRINDLSGNGFDFRQSTDANRPILTQDAEGKYYLSCNGTGQELLCNIRTMPAGYNKATVVGGMLAGTVSGAGGPDQLGIYANSSDTQWAWFLNGGLFRAQVADGSATTADATISANTKYVTAMWVDISGPTAADRLALRVNGVGAGTPTGNGNGVSQTFPAVAHRVARYGNSRWNGRIYRRVIRYVKSTTQEIENTEAWVNAGTGAWS